MNYEMFILNPLEEIFSDLNGKFVYASVERIKYHDKLYRILRYDESKRLDSKYSILEKAEESTNVLCLNTVVMIPEEWLEKPAIPDGVPVDI